MPATTEPEAEQLPRILTAGLIATQLGVTRDRVAHILKTRPHIAHRYRVGNTRIRLYDSDVVALVRQELNAIDARQAHRDEAGDSSILPET